MTVLDQSVDGPSGTSRVTNSERIMAREHSSEDDVDERQDTDESDERVEPIEPETPSYLGDD
jgi:hypothetical protein